MSLKPPSTVNDDTLDLTVRFSASLPDLLLSISLTSQPHANTSTLKQLIREHLPAEYNSRRIRLIHSGKALVDDAPLSTSLKRNVSRPPSRAPTPAPYGSQHNESISSKVKGKTPLRDPPTAAQRIYIHCSIGDVVLSASELSAEQALSQPTHQNATTSSSTPAPQEPDTTPAPRGFDRLLSSGFTPAEISSLRLQFLNIQSHTHTPNDMPSPNTLRNMEDQWLDNSSSPTSTDTFVGVGGAGGGFTDDETGMIDDVLSGMAMGFFWPIGCLVWGVREEGIWTKRKRMAVVLGVLLNVGVGLVRYTK